MTGTVRPGGRAARRTAVAVVTALLVAAVPACGGVPVGEGRAASGTGVSPATPSPAAPETEASVDPTVTSAGAPTSTPEVPETVVPSAGPGTPGAPTATSPVTPAPQERPAREPDPRSSPAPSWLGTRALGPAGSGPVDPQTTPTELLDRRIRTVDVLPPPPDDRFRHVVSTVPAEVLARSTWQPACPVAAEDLRYLTVAFWGFDGLPHTGEVLVHADAVEAVVAAFAAMHAERFPLEEVRVISAAELDAAPTGDGNVTSAFVCRPVVGGGRWSAHAYGLALDVNPFHNPYERDRDGDRVVVPELATAYTDRDRVRPGMVAPSSAVVEAFRAAGWTWGGDYRSVRDWMHFSADGR